MTDWLKQRCAALVALVRVEMPYGQGTVYLFVCMSCVLCYLLSLRAAGSVIIIIIINGKKGHWGINVDVILQSMQPIKDAVASELYHEVSK